MKSENSAEHLLPFARKSSVENPKTAANGKYHSKPLQLYIKNNNPKVKIGRLRFSPEWESLSNIFEVPIIRTSGVKLDQFIHAPCNVLHHFFGQDVSSQLAQN